VRKSKSSLGGAGLAGALAALLVGCGGSSSAPAPVASSTPKASDARGRDVLAGAELAAADLNVRGGVLGQKVKIVSADDGCSAAGARAGVAKLGDALAGAVGGVCADAAGAAARSLAGTPFLITSANSPRIVSAKRTPTAYLLNGTPYQSALAAVHWLAYARSQKLAVLTDGDRASRFLGEQVVGLAAPVPEAVAQERVRDVDVSVRAALAGEPDTVYWAGAATHGGEVLAALRAAGFEGAFVASAESEDPAFLAAAGDAAEGAYVIAPASPANLPEAGEFAARFEKEYGHAAGVDALQAYEGVRALAQAVTQSGKVDAERNSAELAALDETFSTFLGGELAFASDHTVKYDNNIVLRVSGGKYVVENTLRSQS
jgi:branched-chain amino acid transport system substrate-binding protein